MPFGRRPYKKRTYKKRTYKPRPSRALAFKTNVNTGRGFPKKMTMTHKFFHNGLLTNTTGTPSSIATEQFPVNGMFKPVDGSDTHQPLYFDQMSAIYNKFTVIGSKIKITFVNNQGVNSSGAILTAFLNDKNSTIVPVLMSTMIEQTGGKFQVMRSAGNASSGINKSFDYTWSAKKRFGNGVLANNDLSGNDTTNPVITPGYVIAMQDMSKTTTETVAFTVEITYISVWSGLKDIGGS